MLDAAGVLTVEEKTTADGAVQYRVGVVRHAFREDEHLRPAVW